MPIEVIVTDEFLSWYESLSEREQDRVAVSVGLLEERGVALPYPYSSAIKGARFALRELRIPAAERIWNEYLAETRQKSGGKK